MPITITLKITELPDGKLTTAIAGDLKPGTEAERKWAIQTTHYLAQGHSGKDLAAVIVGKEDDVFKLPVKQN